MQPAAAAAAAAAPPPPPVAPAAELPPPPLQPPPPPPASEQHDQENYTVAATINVALGQRAFSNHNGIGLSASFSPSAPSPRALAAAAAVAAAGGAPAQHHHHSGPPPPPMLAVVLDASMEQGALSAAAQAVAAAASQLPPQTRLLVLLADQVVSAVDLKTPRPQTWVLHALGQGAALLPALAQAADIRATPLAHCQGFLGASLGALTHHPRHQSVAHHLQVMNAAVDIALFLLTASMAAWDAQHRQQPPAASRQQQQQQQPELPHEHLQQAMHNARVMVLTSLPNSSCPDAHVAAELLQLLDEQPAQQLRGMTKGLGAKAASLDIPVDVITGSLSAPAALLLQEVAARSHGQVLHQPQLAPPLAANIAGIACSRFGHEGVIDVQLPPGVKLLQLSGPVASGQRLPQAALLSGTSMLPVLVMGAQGAGAQDGAQQQKQQQHGGAVQWGPAAAAVPVLASGSRFVATLELSKDWPAGSSFGIVFVCEWTAADGRRIRQVARHTVEVSDRLGPYLEGLDVPAVVLLLSQRLIGAGAAGSGSDSSGSSGGSLGVTALPSKRAVEDGRLAVGLALEHVAQRLGHAHTSRRGLFGFGAQQVWQLPDELIPLALSLYQLQRGPLLNPAAAAAAHDAWSGGGGRAGGGFEQQQQEPPLLVGGWRLLVTQFMQCAPSTALRMVAPWLYVLDAASGQFDVLPPLNLALEPDTLAVLDCGDEVIIYVGSVLTALVERSSTAGQQQQQQHEGATTSAAMPPAANGHHGGVPVPPMQQNAAAAAAAVPDMAEAAAPAVRCAHELIRGRFPVPAIRIVEDASGMAALARRLLPLHDDPLALQVLLLPHLRDLSPAQHSHLIEWHRRWAGGEGGGSGGGVRAGGSRLAAAEGAEELSFGSWYSSFGVVLKSPAGALAGGDAVE